MCPSCRVLVDAPVCHGCGVKNTFSHLLPCSLDEIRELDETAIKEAVVVIDTNVLLDLYRRTPAAQDSRFRALEVLGDRLVVPYQVGLEFHRRRGDVADELPAAFKTARAAVAAMETALGRFGNPHFAETRDLVTQAAVEAAAGLRKTLKEIEARDLTVTGVASDQVLPRIEVLLDGRVLKAPSAKKVRRRVARFFSYRVPNEVPPGYLDADKKTATAAAGDYLIWCEILAFAKKDGRPVLFVTNDGKDDWWLQGGKDRPEQPLSALIGEFRDLTKVAYHQVKFSTFFNKVEALLGVPVSAEVLAEEAVAEEEQAAATEQSRVQAAFRDTRISGVQGVSWWDAVLATEARNQEALAQHQAYARGLVAVGKMDLSFSLSGALQEHAARSRALTDVRLVRARDSGALSPFQRLSAQERAALRGAMSDYSDPSLGSLAQRVADGEFSFDDTQNTEEDLDQEQ